MVVGNSYSKSAYHGKTMVVASKNTVPCRGGGRCAGDWCEALSVFLVEESTVLDDQKMGWRKGSIKVCLTHLKTEDGKLILPPPGLEGEDKPLTALAQSDQEVVEVDTVTWSDLAEAHASGNLNQLAYLARKLMSENEVLSRKVIEAQDKLIQVLVE